MTDQPMTFDFDADCNEVLDHFAGKPTGERLTRVRKYDYTEGDDVYHVQVAHVNMEGALAGISCHVTLDREFMHVALIELTQERRGQCHAKFIPLTDKITSPLFYRNDPDMLKRWATRQRGLDTAQFLAVDMWKRAIMDWPTRKQTSAGDGQSKSKLTDEDIAHRRDVVKQACQLRTDEPKRGWKDIARELGESERTLRDWRHNPTYR